VRNERLSSGDRGSVRVGVVTTGRFHVLDLARELSSLGHRVAFYSCVPRARAARFGLPPGAHRNILAPAVPLLLAQRLGPRFLRPALDRALLAGADRLAARFMEPCDAFIGMSGLCVESAAAARRRFGALVFVERGSRHILSQKEILDAMPACGQKKTVPWYAVERELATYEAADVIVVPSRHAEQSFLERGMPSRKIFRNPYGVDLRMFPATPAPPPDPPVLLHVGAWSLRKGCDVLTEAWRRLRGVRLLHVGPVEDLPLPREPLFEHHNPVPQWRLNGFYGRAHVLVLASREEGLALVLVQALASGLFVVCTDRTGGEDLRELLADPSAVSIVPPDDPDRLAAAAGVDASNVTFHAFPRVRDRVRESVQRIRESPLLPASFGASGFVYDVRSGRLEPVA